MNRTFVFTSESVTPGHPDKLCDQISDAVVDAFLERDPTARVATEAAVSGGVVFLAAHFSADARPDLGEIARAVVADAGYAEGAFNAEDCTVMASQALLPAERFPRIDADRLSEDAIDRIVAGNLVTVFGFACDDTPPLMPLPIAMAHALAQRLHASRRTLKYLGPDAKAQVGITYEGGRPRRVHSVTVVATQHIAGKPRPERLRDDLVQHVVEPVLQRMLPDAWQGAQIAINPEGPVVGGGPALHAGLTGRKNDIDTYGEFARHSGAALSGKDPLRIDRTGAYAARHAAKQVVAAGLATQCELQLSYSIGHARPVGVRIETFGTGKVDDAELERRVAQHFDFRPAGIVRRFGLQHLPKRRNGFYRQLAVFGQMGREDLDAPWERLDAVDWIR
jgi:S-adenosylmethionine synthetase